MLRDKKTKLQLSLDGTHDFVTQAKHFYTLTETGLYKEHKYTSFEKNCGAILSPSQTQLYLTQISRDTAVEKWFDALSAAHVNDSTAFSVFPQQLTT